MPTENWYPISGATHNLPASHDAWVNSGGANKNASTTVGGGRTGPATHDDATSFISAGSGSTGLNVAQALNIDWPGPVGAFVGMDVNFRTLTSGGASTRDLRMVNAAGTLGGIALTASSDDPVTWINTGPTDITNGATYRPGGGSWDPVDFANDQTIFARVFVSVSNNSLVTSIWGGLNYSPPSGGFVFLFNLAGLGALPFVGAMDFSQFMRYLSWRRAHHPRHTILTGAEVRQAWRELREYKHPRFFFPAVA